MVYTFFSCIRRGEFHIQSLTHQLHIRKQATTYTTNRFILFRQRRVLYQFMGSEMLMVEFDRDGQFNVRVTRETAPRKMVGTDHLYLGFGQQAQESRSLLSNDFFNNSDLIIYRKGLCLRADRNNILFEKARIAHCGLSGLMFSLCNKG